MELDFNSLVKGYSKYQKVYRSLIKVTWDYLGLKCQPVISVTMVDNEFIHQINRIYRHIDRPTDVITFAFLDGDKNREKLLKSKTDVVLGDIYISTEKAKEQAETYGHSIDRELSFLFVHGLLHLLGYDHMTEADEKIMFPLQEEILKHRGEAHD